jgi:hypothetical protein
VQQIVTGLEARGTEKDFVIMLRVVYELLMGENEKSSVREQHNFSFKKKLYNCFPYVTVWLVLWKF